MTMMSATIIAQPVNQPRCGPVGRGDPREPRAAVRVGAVHVVVGHRDAEHRDERHPHDRGRREPDGRRHETQRDREAVGGSRRGHPDDDVLRHPEGAGLQTLGARRSLARQLFACNRHSVLLLPRRRGVEGRSGDGTPSSHATTSPDGTPPPVRMAGSRLVPDPASAGSCPERRSARRIARRHPGPRPQAACIRPAEGVAPDGSGPGGLRYRHRHEGARIADARAPRSEGTSDSPAEPGSSGPAAGAPPAATGSPPVAGRDTLAGRDTRREAAVPGASGACGLRLSGFRERHRDEHDEDHQHDGTQQERGEQRGGIVGGVGPSRQHQRCPGRPAFPTRPVPGSPRSQPPRTGRRRCRGRGREGHGGQEHGEQEAEQDEEPAGPPARASQLTTRHSIGHGTPSTLPPGLGGARAVYDAGGRAASPAQPSQPRPVPPARPGRSGSGGSRQFPMKSVTRRVWPFACHTPIPTFL